MSTSTAMASSLDLAVVAEGVETSEQLDYMRAQGIDLVQGFYISKPLDAAAFHDLIKNNHGMLFQDVAIG